MSEKQTDGLSVRSYLRVLARRKWVVIVVTLLVTVAGTAYAWRGTPMYTAASQLLYVKQIDIANPTAQSFIDTTAQQAEIQAVPTVIHSQQVHSAAQAQMDPKSIAAGYSVNAVLEPGLNNSYSNVVTIEGYSPSASASADAANAYAQAFIDWGRDSSRQRVQDAIKVVTARLETFTSSASQQTSEYTSLQQSLQQLQLLEASASGDFEIITKASVPSAPYAPDKKRSLILALAAGLVLSGLLAFVLEQLDTRLHGDEQVIELLGLPIIGHVPSTVGKGKNAALPTLSDPAGRPAEAYRLLRSNLDFIGFDGELRSLVVSSSVQGEGKSISVCNLAVALALVGKRVVLVDADLRSPRVHAYLGIPNVVGLSMVLARRVKLDEAIVDVALDAGARQSGSLVMTKVAVSSGASKVTEVKSTSRVGAGGEGLWPGEPEAAPVLRVLTSGPIPPNPGEMIASQRFAEIIASLSQGSDIVLVDAPAMLPVGDTAAIARAVDGIVYVVNPDRVRRPVLQQARAQLRHLPCALLGIIEIADRRGQGQYSGYYDHSDDGSGLPRHGR
ncbi:MAG TPA: Wzz/FepE/Etk N-terminal domain-containing protein [Thermoleophilia bacterium]|nr:Wzz/FepE/Etk N-terminal domain-containing protein [Thermoleophilia bacterium]